MAAVTVWEPRAGSGPAGPHREWTAEPVSTGTTITAVEFDGGVIIGADSRTITERAPWAIAALKMENDETSEQIQRNIDNATRNPFFEKLDYPQKSFVLSLIEKVKSLG